RSPGRYLARHRGDQRRPNRPGTRYVDRVAENVAKGLDRRRPPRRGVWRGGTLARNAYGADGAGTSVTVVDRSAGKYFLKTSCSTCGVIESMRWVRVRIS